ncbi:MAG TPA: FAD-dependent hydroxylase [Gammaproteobacteria bacterium]|jgi:ubiquinone biosynthesis UbiH/UbiF/VisC/COQ6 family hydroxylase|nr:5-demethoxyubiquinol-8 5-hydroxylase UbiM [Gammaproteobacteria bacterium]HIK97438.1 FAD-dependent hydroxylase [Gammaproteobacteria bacterium]
MNFDVTIVGAGPVGLSFARALSDTSLNIAIIDRQTSKSLANPPEDGREIALTHLSKKILTSFGIWQEIDQNEISLIKEAKVINGASPYSLHFNHQDTSENTLGHLIPNRLVRAAAYKVAKESKAIKIITGVGVDSFNIDANKAEIKLSNKEIIHCSLMIAADGRLSGSRRSMGIPSEVKDFGKTVIVCKMEHEKPHSNIAYECFHYGRTLAVLPMVGNYSSIVITISSDQADAIMKMKDQTFNEDIQTRFNSRLGGMMIVGKKYSYPLYASHASHFHANRFALIGDASVGMHPVTAHGFNLGLRGSKTLATVIEEALSNKLDFASVEILSKYNQKHQRSTRPLYYGTNLLVDLYNSERLTAKVLRRLALRFGNNFWPVKKLIMGQLTEVQ